MRPAAADRAPSPVPRLPDEQGTARNQCRVSTAAEAAATAGADRAHGIHPSPGAATAGVATVAVGVGVTTAVAVMVQVK